MQMNLFDLILLFTLEKELWKVGFNELLTDR